MLRRKLFPVIIAVIILVTVFTSSASAWTVPPLPTLMNDNSVGNSGDWYVGAIPQDYDPGKPVLVFVQGLHGKAQNWYGSTAYYGRNDMYDYAYNNGYRTAFVNFRDADGNAGSMWLNGSTLRTQLEKICSYYGVPKVNIVAHSKGGVDTQSAIVHYGAGKYVDTVFTLSTPHWGSEAADLAYSWWAGWLAEVLGSKDDGTYVLQTGYMSYFRSITDNRAENNQITYYTAAGTDWGPLFSKLWFGGLYLSFYGDNDGLVTVTRAHNPRATHVITGKLNHDNIRMGSKSWGYVEPRISNFKIPALKTMSVMSQTVMNEASSTPVVPAQPVDSTKRQGNRQVQGGKIRRNENIIVPVDSSTTLLYLDLIVSNSDVKVKITSPDGKEYEADDRVEDTDFFSGATHIVKKIDKPVPGNWKIRASSRSGSGYLLITNFESSLQAEIQADKAWTKAGKDIDFTVNFKGQSMAKLKKSSVKAVVSHVKKKDKKKVAEVSFEKKGNGFGKRIDMPSEPGLYNISVSVDGVLDDGTPYSRSIVYSTVIDSEDKQGNELLEEILAK